MKIFAVVTLLLVTFTVTACMPTNRPYAPSGVWKSENPTIILYFDENYQAAHRPHDFLGMYMREGEKVHIFILFHGQLSAFNIMSATALRNGISMSGDDLYYSGRFRVVGDRMYYTLGPRTQERTGLTQIIFHRVYDYPPINSEDWFPAPAPTPGTANKAAP